MGSVTTGKYKFFKPSGSDFVDPDMDMQDNFAILDSAVYKALRFSMNSTFTNHALSDPNYVDGYREYNIPTGRVKYLGFSEDALARDWWNFPSLNNIQGWNNITLLSPYATDTTNQCNTVAWRWTDPGHSHVELKGRFWNGSAAMPNYVETAITAASAVPIPSNNNYFTVTPNVTTNNPADNQQAARIKIENTGIIRFTHQGASANHSDNSLYLDNIIYRI